HEFIDYTMGWGSTILGYADERIQEAIGERLSTSPLAPFPDPIEMEVSEMIAEDFPSAEMVAFGKNGSDACTVAARLARIATGMPLSAVAGRASIFHAGFARTHYCPTFKAEIYSLAAAKAAIGIYRREPVAEWIWRTGNQLKKGIDALCRELTIPGVCQGPPF